MARRVSFWARKPYKVPKRICFKTKSGKRVCFVAKKTFRRPIKISFLIKKRK